MSLIAIRSATRDDISSVFAAHRQTLLTHQMRHPYAFASDAADSDESSSMGYLFTDGEKKLKESPDIFIAEKGGEFAGYIWLSPALREQFEHGKGEICDIYVTPKFRGSGVADALIEHVKSLCSVHDWDNLTATVWEGNEWSQRLFKRHAFVPQNTKYRFGPQRAARKTPKLPELPDMKLDWSSIIWLFIAFLSTAYLMSRYL